MKAVAARHHAIVGESGVAAACPCVAVKQPEFIPAEHAASPPTLTSAVYAHAAFLYRAARHFGVPPEDSEDLVQEVYLTLAERPERFHGRSALRTFLYGVLRNKVREYRRGIREKAVGDDLETFASRFDAHGQWSRPPADLSRTLESAEAGAAVHRCLGDIAYQQREIFILREMEGLRPREISRLLGLTLDHCGVLFHRARLRLRECLERAGWGPANARDAAPASHGPRQPAVVRPRRAQP
jgi:RNA polymerase sigma-70 factor (ECF subfamily)